MKQKLAFWILRRLGYWPVQAGILKCVGAQTFDKIGVHVVVFGVGEPETHGGYHV